MWIWTKKQKYLRCLKEIIDSSDLIIFRDKKSAKSCIDLSKNKEKIFYCLDQQSILLGTIEII